MLQLFDWEQEDEGREGVYFLTIADFDGDEVAIIVHRVCNGRYPLDGELAKQKVRNAKMLIEAWNYMSLHIDDVLGE
jgi:hypothetical protein